MASGNTLFTFHPMDSESPTSNYPTLDARNAIAVLDFDASTAETVYFRGVVPSHYSGGGLTLDVYWMATSATTGDVKWEAAWEENDPNNNDLDADAFGTASNVTTTTNGTSGKVTKSTITITHANMGSPAAGDPFRLRLKRLAADGGDTMTGDAEFLVAHGKET